jgi:hypothetical protein
MTPTKTKSRKWWVAAALAGLVAATPVALALSYVLPSKRVVRIVGADVLRYDPNDRMHRQTIGDGGMARDVYQIFTEDPETKKQHVYHNEDTRWSFPWYFKFGSADLQGTANSIAGDREHNLAEITSYGWRIKMFSMFPNATSIKRVEPGHVSVPWFNITFLLVLLFVAGWATLLVRRYRRSRIAPPSAVNRVPS